MITTLFPSESWNSSGIYGCIVHRSQKSIAAAGKSVREPLFGTAVFDNDQEVDDFVQQHPTTTRANEVCNH